MTSPSFRKLQKQWYKKLKEEGFKDIETVGFYMRSAINLRAVATKDREAIQEYYSNATSVLYETEFDNEKDKKIWELHCEGLSVRKVASKYGVSKTTAQTIINKIQRKYKLRVFK